MDNEQVEEQHKRLKEELEKEFGIKDEFKINAIGFLSISEPYETGEVPTGFIEKLRQVYDNGMILASLGHHDCEFCINKGVKPATSSSEKSIRDEKNKIEYRFPQMIFHYIEEHQFKPQQKFIDFIMEQ